MDRIKKSDTPLMKQYKRWAKYLLDCNPRYVTDPASIVWYIKGPNWDGCGTYYRTTVKIYGKELLEKFEHIRSLPDDEAKAEYAELMKAAGVTAADGE